MEAYLQPRNKKMPLVTGTKLEVRDAVMKIYSFSMSRYRLEGDPRYKYLHRVYESPKAFFPSLQVYGPQQVSISSSQL
jgi:hypothetical protein